jgi:hypothetical protein
MYSIQQISITKPTPPLLFREILSLIHHPPLPHLVILSRLSYHGRRWFQRIRLTPTLHLRPVPCPPLPRFPSLTPSCIPSRQAVTEAMMDRSSRQ